MRLDAEGVNLIASFEGYVGRPYNDAVGYATVGYGHLIGYRHVTSADIAHFAGWTQVDYKRLLKTDCARFEAAVRQAIHVQLTQGEFNALVSLAFNCGPGAVQGSIARLANSGRKSEIPTVMRQYVRANGQVLRGLVDRREREIRVFRHASPVPVDTLAHLTSAERRWCREYDRLKRSGTNLARRRALRVAMEEQRKRIWQAAKADGHGNVKSGMQLHHRQERYHSLLARTT
jgi:lysozyme